MTGEVSVIGYIWMPSNVLCAYDYRLGDYEIDNMRGEDGKIARCDIERWLATHAGDFSAIEDFRASIGIANYGWKDAESEFVYNDIMWGEDA